MVPVHPQTRDPGVGTLLAFQEVSAAFARAFRILHVFGGGPGAEATMTMASVLAVILIYETIDKTNHYCEERYSP